jgi:hypothetical protein
LIEGFKAVTADANADGATGEVPTRTANAPHAPATHTVINTARLIQNMQDSELRVGIKSADFGNISISASAGRGTLSAQISLEHSDLAKEIAANIPEIRAALGGGHLDVRVVTGGQMGAHTDTGANQSGSGGSQTRAQGEAHLYSAPEETVASENNLPRDFAGVSASMGLSHLDVRI